MKDCISRTRSEQQMRVLHVTPSVGPLRGGPSKSVESLCQGLAAEGVLVTLLTTDDNGSGHLDVPLGQPIKTDGYTRIYFHRQTNAYTISIPLLRWLDKHIDQFDIVHVHAVFCHTSDWTPFVVRRHQKPYGITPRGILGSLSPRRHRPLLKRLFYHFLVGPNLRRAAFVQFTSALERQEARWETYPQAVVIPNGLPLYTEETNSDTNGDTCRVLFLARLDPIKRLELLLQAIAQLQQQGETLKLIVAGDGAPDYVQKLHKKTAELGIAALVEWAGFVSGEKKRALLRKADLLVVPSYYESFGVAAVEALAAGVPVIVSEAVGIAPDVSAAGAGLVVSSDVKNLADALQQLIENPEQRHQMGMNGQRLVREHYSVEAVARSMVKLYQETLSYHRDQVEE